MAETNVHFLQSKEWEEFQKSVGKEVFRIDGALFIKLPLAFGKSYLYCGGCLTFNVKQVLDLAKKENVVFLKVEPMVEDTRLANELVSAGFRKSKKEIQPQRTIILDITQSEEQILARMRAKTRYNIHLAQRKNLRLKVYDQGGAGGVFDAFWQMLRNTARRDRFHLHEKVYYEKQLWHTKLFALTVRGKMAAGALVLFFHKSAVYLHGASDYTLRNYMAPYLLHLEITKYAKEQGYKEYDFWGVDPKKWPGLTRFKRGFGGRELEYIGSYDYVFQPFWYAAYNFYRKLKAKL
jgi:lipid II:glycine glycyltransferase (peptidoglycan interpeptide bridge formation enzyme)